MLDFQLHYHKQLANDSEKEQVSTGENFQHLAEFQLFSHSLLQSSRHGGCGHVVKKYHIQSSISISASKLLVLP